MEESREQILADFQSCTGLDDVAECIMHLEAANWNLLEALNSVMPQETQTLPSEHRNIPIEVIDDSSFTETNSRTSRPNILPGTAHSDHNIPLVCVEDGPPEMKILNISVKYKDRIIHLEIPDTETIASIKTALFSEFGILPCRQQLCGWKQNHFTDDTILSTLKLPSHTNLILSTTEAQSMSSTQLSFSDKLNMMFKLHITDESNNKDYTLSFPGSKTIQEIKQDIYAVTNIPVRFQQWIGWPESAADESMTLAAIDINFPIHNLLLKRKESLTSKKIVDIMSSGSSGDEFEDANECVDVDDDIFQTTSLRKQTSLIPENIEDENSALVHLNMEFITRYGDCHPIFFQGTLSDALLHSCQRPANERKPLIIYLHHDSSVLTNVFCTQLLCSETIVTYLTQNFVTWGWDLTHEINKTRFLTAVTQQLGVVAANAIQNIAVDHLPALIVITRIRSATEVLTVIPGNVSLDELMTRLIHAVEVFNNELSSEILQEQARLAREEVKREQDAAYEASLKADQAKEEARRLELEEKNKREQAEQMELQKLEEMKKQEEAIKEAICQSLAEQLPLEPPEDSPESISHIRIRLPCGEYIDRRFLVSSPLRFLLMFVASRGYPMEEYKVLANWPRRDLTTLPQENTLGELKLYPKETLTLEER